MKLVIKPHGMRIETESVQDVAYLKHIGYYSDSIDILMKVSVTKTYDTINKVEGAGIDIRWENKSCGGCDGAYDHIEYEHVQHLEGRRQSLIRQQAPSR